MKKRKANILARENHRCWYCGADLTMVEPTLDHVTPKSRGGKSNSKNLVACCSSCNMQKRDLTLEEFRAEVFLQQDSVILAGQLMQFALTGPDSPPFIYATIAWLLEQAKPLRFYGECETDEERALIYDTFYGINLEL